MWEIVRNKKFRNVKPSRYQPKNLEIVLPVYNEVETIEKVIAEWDRYLTPVVRYRFVVCEDGSTDGTTVLLRQLLKHYPIRLIQKKKRQGYGSAVLSGILSSTAPHVLCIDSDGQCDPRDFYRFWMNKDKGDVIIGWREHRADPLLRKLFSVMFRVWFRLLYPNVIHDPSAPFVLFKRSKIVPHLRGALFLREGFWWGFTALCLKSNIKIIEKPIHHRERLSGKTQIYQLHKIPGIVGRNLIDLIKLRFS